MSTDNKPRDWLTDDIHTTRVDNSTRQQVKVIFLFTYDHSVSSIVTSLNTTASSHHNVQLQHQFSLFQHNLLTMASLSLL